MAQPVRDLHLPQGMAVVRHNQEERSLTDLFSDVTRESADLIRKEIELAKLEVAENVTALKTAAVSMAVAVPLLYAGFLVLLGAAVLALDVVIQRLWLSALIVGASAVVLGFIAFFAGRAGITQAEIVPEQSLRSLRDDKEMIEQHV